MDKERLISIEMYANWFLCNIFPCLLPIGIIWSIGKLNGDLNLSVVLSSILAFLFTLMITSIYIFNPVYSLTKLRRVLIGGDFLVSASIYVACGVLVFFVAYNLVPKLQEIMNNDMKYWIPLLVVLVMAFLMNRPTIKERIDEKKHLVEIAEIFSEGERKGDKWIGIFGKGKSK